MKKIKNAVVFFAFTFLMTTCLKAQVHVNGSKLNDSDVLAEVLFNVNIDDQSRIPQALMRDFADCSESGLFNLLMMLEPSKSYANQKIYYVISNLASYLNEKGDATARKNFLNTILKYLEKMQPDAATTVSLFEYINVCYSNKTGLGYSELLNFVDNEKFAPHIIHFFANAQDSKDVIFKYIIKRNGEVGNKAYWAYAIGKQQVTDLKDVLESWLKDADESTQIEIYAALVKLGDTKKPLKELAKASKKGIDDGKYVDVLYFLENQHDTVVVEKAAKKLFKDKNAKNKIAGLYLLEKIQGEKSLPYFYKALKNNDLEVRNAAFCGLKPYADDEVCATVVKKYITKNNIVDVIAWLGDVKCRSQMEFLKKQLASEDSSVVEAAIVSIVKIENIDCMYALVPMFDTDYQLVIKNTLQNYEGNLQPVIDSLMRGSDGQKIAAFNLMEDASYPKMYNIVRAQFYSANPQLKEAAYKALKSVVVPAQYYFLKTQMEMVDDHYVAYVQEALSAAFATTNDAQKDNFISLLKHVKPEVMPRFYKVFANFGTQTSVNRIIEVYNSENHRKEAVEALCAVKNPAFADTIYAIAMKDAPNREPLMANFVKLVAKSGKSDVYKITSYRNVLGLDPSYELKKLIINNLAELSSHQAMTLASYYLDDPQTAHEAAEAVITIVSNNSDLNGKEVIDILLKIKGLELKEDYSDRVDWMIAWMTTVKRYELTPAEKKDGFVMLFDGTNLDSWTGDKTDYIIKNGTICVTEDYGDEGSLYTIKEYGDFIYRFEFCFTKAGVDNGVGIRTPLHTEALKNGMEIQISDNNFEKNLDIPDYEVHGSVVGVIPAERVAFPKLGTWNTEEIYVKGDYVKVTLNGIVILEGNVRDACKGRNMAPEGRKGAKSGTLDGKNHPGLFNKSGHISFCGQGDGLLIRNVRIKEL